VWISILCETEDLRIGLVQVADAISAFREIEAVYQIKGGQFVFNILIDFCCKQGKVRSST